MLVNTGGPLASPAAVLWGTGRGWAPGGAATAGAGGAAAAGAGCGLLLRGRG